MMPRSAGQRILLAVGCAIKPLLEHITAGMQYVLGDLQADDRPSKR